MRPILRKTIEKFHNHLELLLEDITLDEMGYTLAFYFDTAHLQRAALGYKDYYREDDSFKAEKFNSDITLVCSLVSGGFVGPFRLLHPHQNEFLDKIKTRFGGVDYERWGDEVRAFVEHSGLNLNADEFLSQLRDSNNEELIQRFAEHAEMSKRGLNVSHSLLPWDRRLPVWDRKELLVLDAVRPDYDAIFSSDPFNVLKNKLDEKRTYKISNFIDATALTILMEQTRVFKEDLAAGAEAKTKWAPRFFMPESKYDYLRDALEKTKLISNLEYTSVLRRKATVLRNEEYFFYRAFFRKPPRNGGGGAEARRQREELTELYDKTSEILAASSSAAQVDFDDKALQEVIDRMENYSFLKNVWIEFINSGDLQVILHDLEDIRRHFEEFKKSYEDVSFAEQVREKLVKAKKNIFDNLDEVKRASVIWYEVDNKITELRGKFGSSHWDSDALFRNRKLFRYGFPEKYQGEIKQYLSDLLSLDAEPSQRAVTRVVSHYMKLRGAEGGDDQRALTLTAAVFCALEMKDRLRTLLVDWRRRRRPLHYSLLIALAGAELELNQYKRGKELIDELERAYYGGGELSPADRCNLEIGLTYLCYYAWLARRRMTERQAAQQQQQPAEGPKADPEAQQLIHNAAVFAERATSLVGGRELAHRVYAYNQHLMCLVEGENPEQGRKMRDAAAKLNEYRDQPDVWSYMYYDTLARYFRLRALEQAEPERRQEFMRLAVGLSSDAVAAAPHDEEIKKFHTKLLDESD